MSGGWKDIRICYWILFFMKWRELMLFFSTLSRWEKSTRLQSFGLWDLLRTTSWGERPCQTLHYYSSLMQFFSSDWKFYINIYKVYTFKNRPWTVISIVDYWIFLESTTMFWEVLCLLSIKVSLNIKDIYWEVTHSFIA